jgi:hypothetical protein
MSGGAVVAGSFQGFDQACLTRWSGSGPASSV